MTRARALKQVIRARAAKTGERYTTARRHVLRELNAPLAPPALRTLPAPTKGALSDAKSREKTGQGLDYWFAVLDRFGAVDKGHTAAAKHLFEDHGVPGWYCQGITVGYERARGVRGMNQRCDGAFEVSVSKVIAANTTSLIKAIADARRRRTWTANADADLTKALTAGFADSTSKGFVVRPDGQARFRYKWNGTTVQFYLLPKSSGRVSLVVQHTKLPDAKAVEDRRSLWKTALSAIAATFAP